jgi:riboflavin synthase
MFTGIVGATGRVVEWRAGHLGIEEPDVAARLKVGSSIAVNGVCLTVVELEGGTFFADVIPESRRRTTLGGVLAGDQVNLELPLRASSGLDGHLVQGHVDGVASIREVREVEMGREITVELPRDLAPFVAEKGSITLDGVSLTVTGVDDEAGTFGVALIPHTLAHTIAGQYDRSTLVNVEVDVVARYVGRLIGHRIGEGS